MRQQYDLLIAGGGLAGNCLALALKESGLRFAVIEAQTRVQQHNSPAGDRALALSAGTVNMMEALGIWQGIAHAATAIKKIHVSDQGHFGKTRMSAQNENVPALGYVITARAIETHVAKLVDAAGAELISPAKVESIRNIADQIDVTLNCSDQSTTLSAKLLVGADGGMSTVRRLLNIPQQLSDYGQTALVTTVKSSLPHHNTAYERFTASGPLALLPVDSRHSAVVWTRSKKEAEALMGAGEQDFLDALQQCFGYKLGALSLVAPRRAFPLSLIRAGRMVSGRAVIIGNAVHQLHPVAGQGFNLALRDVVFLAEMLLERHRQGHDIGASEGLQSYAAARRKDHDQTILFTDRVVKIFSNEWLALAAARNVGLTLLDHLPPVKSVLAKHAMGLAGSLPVMGIKSK